MKKYFFILVLLCPFLKAGCQSNNFLDTLTTDGAIKYYQSLLKRNNHSAFGNYGMASACFVKNNYEDAITYSRRNVRDSNEYQAECLIILASSLDRTNRPSDAVRVFENAIKSYPTNYQLLYQYALCSYKNRKFWQAINLVKKVINLQPLFVPAHYLYGCCMFENNNDRNCAAAFLFGLLLDKDSLRAQQAIIFNKQYLLYKIENIEIPYFEKRKKILTIDHVLYFYFPEIVRTEILKSLDDENTYNDISNYLTANQKSFPAEYNIFYKNLSDSGLNVLFSHYCSRMSLDATNKIWLKAHSKDLEQFAKFLDKYLPGK